MACLEVKLGVAKWKVQMNPLSYGGTLANVYFTIRYSNESFVLYCFFRGILTTSGCTLCTITPPNASSLSSASAFTAKVSLYEAKWSERSVKHFRSGKWLFGPRRLLRPQIMTSNWITAPNCRGHQYLGSGGRIETLSNNFRDHKTYMAAYSYRG